MKGSHAQGRRSPCGLSGSAGSPDRGSPGTARRSTGRPARSSPGRSRPSAPTAGSTRRFTRSATLAASSGRHGFAIGLICTGGRTGWARPPAAARATRVGPRSASTREAWRRERATRDLRRPQRPVPGDHEDPARVRIAAVPSALHVQLLSTVPKSARAPSPRSSWPSVHLITRARWRWRLSVRADASDDGGSVDDVLGVGSFSAARTRSWSVRS